ncbi:hypothetical protein K0U91_00605 [Chryseobacterium chendengshani]|uniref:hypothetical protein n=1 Tax=Chryseobacterium sp. LJ668 TaxID=2864040 RepID=UPI001C68BA45|nr:hypothetical protein [Chryseobacterium sp. LJ668]MBW8523723.1 hypothetical protein [Chryseobacterium sp. LJ668]QYK16667.1 hypothetical protein K0U91_00605 [Chryseobacterium sp. LJ668]
MKKIQLLTALIFLFTVSNFYSQKITDGATVDLNGLAVTFNILNKESINVGGKSFDRYKVSASATNNSGKSINIRLSNAPQIVTNIGIVEINCINATGAKLTSKKIDLKPKAHNLNVTYWAYNKEGKYESSVIPVIAGYYLDPGDTVSDNAIFVVPQGETPDVSVRKLQ